ncbi:hypothetical protein [uncultured Ruminococcus sp.]|uniref:hypothetical protein n=1 Tax=uncultured Ruminococcus sp. TaxID=165186 RepID=UPI002804C2A0|nr:hypothetical protein [uncultured Ruminococcus sp.]
MDKYRKNDGNTDAEETMFFQASQAGKSTDQYDTQQMNARQIRQQAAQQAGQNSYPGGGYGQNTPYGNRPPEGGYTQNPYASQGYGPEGYSRPNYPQQNYGGQAGGYRPGGNPPGGYAGPNGYGNRPGYNGQQNAASGGYRPYSSSGGYSAGGNAPRQQNRPASGARPVQRPVQQRAPQSSGRSSSLLPASRCSSVRRDSASGRKPLLRLPDITGVAAGKNPCWAELSRSYFL